jgi:hypothetical protein
VTHYFDQPRHHPYALPADCYPLSKAVSRIAELSSRADALPRLIALLAAGEMTAWGSDKDGNKQKIFPSFWKDIPRPERDKIFETDRYDGHRASFRNWRPVFLKTDIDAMFPPDSKLEELPKKPVSSDPANKGGSPYKYDWEPIWIEMCGT